MSQGYQPRDPLDRNVEMPTSKLVFPWVVLGIVLLMVLTVGSMAGCPAYNVYSSTKLGEAELARAQQNRQIAVQEAQAKFESAKLLAQAEVERAKGVAAANLIIAQGLKGNEEYLRYLWIVDVAAQAKGDKTVVYIPTEANMPIMEAARHVEGK